MVNLTENQLRAIPPPIEGAGVELRASADTDRTKMVRRYFRSSSLFVIIPTATLACAVALWGGLHHLWNRAVWAGVEPFPPFDFVATNSLGRAFELVFWVTCAVQLRWIGHCVPARMRRNHTFNDFFSLWLFDTLNTPFISWILIALLQGLTITFASGLRLSLADADVMLFGALSAVLGMSVRETRTLLARMTSAWFKRVGENRSGAAN